MLDDRNFDTSTWAATIAAAIAVQLTDDMQHVAASVVDAEQGCTDCKSLDVSTLDFGIKSQITSAAKKTSH